MPDVPLAGTKAAIDAGCRCVREGWLWDATSCPLHHAPFPPNEPEPES